MLKRNKILLAIVTATGSFPVLAQEVATDGNDIILNIVELFGSIGYGILALMVLIGLYCLYVFGTSLFKMGEEDTREQVKPKTLVASLAGALVLTYGSYVLLVAMNTAFGGEVADAAAPSAWSTPASTPTP
jgi:uncharacterized membrane protein YqhA